MADLEQVVNDLNLASQSLQELREKYDGALDLLDNKNTQITGAIDSAKSNALQEIQTISNKATSQISQLKNTSLNLVNEAKNTAIEEVNNAVSGIDTSKEEALLAIEQAKAAQEEKITDLEQAKENIITELSEKTKLLTQNLKWTVGAGGTHLTLKQALDEACKYKALPNYTITISLKSGYTVNETIYYLYVDLGFVTITSENNTEINSSVSFSFFDSAVPKIDVVFNMTNENKVASFIRCLNSLTITSNGGFKNLSKFSIVNSFVNINAKTLTHNGNYTAYTEICRLDNVIGNFNVKLFSFDVNASGVNPYIFILRNTYIFSIFGSFISNFISGNSSNMIHMINSRIFFINSNILFKGLLSSIFSLINSEITLDRTINIESQLPQNSIIFKFIVGSKITKLNTRNNVTITLGNSRLSNISEGILDTKGNFLQQLI